MRLPCKRLNKLFWLLIAPQPEYLTSEQYGIKGFIMPGDRYFGAEKEGYDLFGVR